MQRRLLIALLTVLVFGAGYFARVWVEREVPLPPPLTPGGEFTPSPSAEPSAQAPVVYHLPTREQLTKEIDRLRPQIDLFRTRLHHIDSEFDRDLLAILTPEQRAEFTARERRRREDPRQVHSKGPELTDEQVAMLYHQPLYAALDHISLTLKLDELNKDLDFTPEQRRQVHALLLRRREEFLALVDTVPPPSLILSRLASVAQRLAGAPGAPAQP
jgi:hypothetical protein